MACSRSSLDGPDLHFALAVRQIEPTRHLHVPQSVVLDNPQLSTDTTFVAAIAHSASQGRLTGEGIRAALYALYVHYLGGIELGLYGLEASSAADADRLEVALRRIWAHNAGLGRARVHRGGRVLVVAWHDCVPASCWEAANAAVAAHLPNR
ncbi:MAG: hypothetical protein KDC98_16625 [Planctomycetes bacterium]|nr:hypothetical protein [Planctomycetota bacterium]